MAMGAGKRGRGKSGKRKSRRRKCEADDPDPMSLALLALEEESKLKEQATQARRVELIRISDAHMDYGYPILRRCLVLLSIQVWLVYHS